MNTVRGLRVRDHVLGGGQRFFLIAGPCVIESESCALRLAEELSKLTGELGIPYVFKASFDKANRTSVDSFRGPGLTEGLRILEKIRNECGVPVLSDVHEVEQVGPAAEVLDILQIPAFLCRQTDLILAAANTGKIVNVKKGQFLAPWDVKNIVKKIEAAGSDQLILTERGVSFGYNNLVVDFKSLPIMRDLGYPVVFDATHSVQLPGGSGTSSSGQSEFVPHLARAAVAVGVDGLFFEVHERPESALSDGPNALQLDRVRDLLCVLKEIDETVKEL